MYYVYLHPNGGTSATVGYCPCAFMLDLDMFDMY